MNDLPPMIDGLHRVTDLQQNPDLANKALVLISQQVSDWGFTATVLRGCSEEYLHEGDIDRAGVALGRASAYEEATLSLQAAIDSALGTQAESGDDPVLHGLETIRSAVEFLKQANRPNPDPADPAS